MTRRTTSTPLSSSPWIAALRNTVGPRSRPRMTITGTLTAVAVYDSLAFRRICWIVPRRISRPPMVSGMSGGRPASLFRAGEADRVLQDRGGDVRPRRPFQPLEPRGGVDLQDLRTRARLEHVHARHLQLHDPRGLKRRVAVTLVQLHHRPGAAPVHVGTELPDRGLAPHRGDHPIADHEGADVA